MEFFMPLKYLYDNNQIVDRGLMDAIHADLGCGSLDFFPDHIQDEDEFLSLLGRVCPDGSQTIDDGILNVDVYEYYEYCFSALPKYCEEHDIPIDLVQEPEFASEQTYFTFIRPGMKEVRVPCNEGGTVLTSIEEIMAMMNEANEETTDTKIMLAISKHLEMKNPYSELNKIRNWV